MSTRNPRRLSLLVSAAALAGLTTLAGSAVAFQPPPGLDLSIPLAEFAPQYGPSPASAEARATAEQAFAGALGGQWTVQSWNRQTGTAHAMVGSGAQVGRAFATADDAVAAAREIIAAAPQVFGADVEDLRSTGAPLGYGKRSVHFQQTYRGLDVIGGTVRLVFTEGGRLFALGSDFHRGITVDPTPSIPATVAGEIAVRGVLPAVGRLVDGTGTPGPALVILPVAIDETHAEHHLAWKVRVWTDEPLGQWATYVDAHSGEILGRVNEVCFVDYTGTTSGRVQRPSYCEGQQTETMPYLRVNVAGAGTTYADANGNWTVPYSGSAPAQATADLYSPFVDIYNYGGTQGSFTGTATPGVPLEIAFTDANSQRDEKDVYRAVNDVHDFYQDIDPAYPYINQMMPAYVSIASTCNAYYVGHTINFYAAGGGCANTGEIMGVVHHEFCHGITEDLLGGQGTEGIGEGNSDVLSNLMTGESIIGRGFYMNMCSSGIRNSENSMQYPEDMNGQIHHDGQIIAGFHWDSWQELQAILPAAEALHVATNTWHWGRVHFRPTNQQDQVLATFMADDDNGNVNDGTPHFDALCVGAQNHGYFCPTVLNGVFVEHEGLVSRTEPGDVATTAVAYSTQGAIVADSTQLVYRVGDGAWVVLPMEPTLNPNEYAATLPGLQMGDVVEYYIKARDVQGNTGTSPVGAPLATWPFDIAPIVEHFEEAESPWMINMEGQDNASGGVWNLVDPTGTTMGGEWVQPENDRTPGANVQCWVTGQSYPGFGPYDSDVDGGRTTVYSQPYDLSGAEIAEVKYWRWYTNDLGTSPGLDTWLVQARNNGGTWTDLENTTASDNSWTFHRFDLLALFGAGIGTVEFRFRASDTGAGSLVEAAVDEFELQTASPQGIATWDGGADRFAFLGGRPNPARGRVEIGFRIPVPSSVRLEVFDVSGRRLRVVADRPFNSGLHTVRWDGRDAGGRAAPGGVYYLRMSTGGFSSTRPVTFLP